MPRRAVRLLLAAALAAGVAGCEKEAVVTEAKTEGIYLDVGELDYQVQLSRVLNPADVEDQSYLAGLPENVLEPDSRETWFAVFLRVQNQTKRAHEPAREFEIVDTEERSYEPIELDPAANAFAYQPTPLPAGTTLPRADSTAADSPTQGAMLLFKMPVKALGNRPLEFKIKQPGVEPDEGVVDLDV